MQNIPKKGRGLGHVTPKIFEEQTNKWIVSAMRSCYHIISEKK